MEELTIPGMKIIDYDKTADNVLEFLTNNFYYPRIYRIYTQANPEHLQSPSLSGMPKSNYGNSNEEKMTKYIEAKAIVDGVNQTYSKGSKELRVVLDNIFGNITTITAMEKLHFEKARYYQIKKRALNEFADVFEVQNLHCPDLHSYIK